MYLYVLSQLIVYFNNILLINENITYTRSRPFYGIVLYIFIFSLKIAFKSWNMLL